MFQLKIGAETKPINIVDKEPNHQHTLQEIWVLDSIWKLFCVWIISPYQKINASLIPNFL